MAQMIRFKKAERDAVAAIVAWLDASDAGPASPGSFYNHRPILRALLAKMEKKLVVVSPPTGLGAARFLEIMAQTAKDRVIKPNPDHLPNSYFARLAKDVRDNGVTEEVAQKAALWISLWKPKAGEPIRLEPRLVAIRAPSYAAKYDALLEKRESSAAAGSGPLPFEDTPREPSGKDDA